MWNWVNHVPVLGHIKAGIHHAAGDHDMGHQALEQANHATSHTPVLGHVKVAVHQAAGDFDQAHETLEKANHSTSYTPVLGHVKAAVHAAAGHHDLAKETFDKANATFAPVMTMALVALCVSLPDALVLAIVASAAEGLRPVRLPDHEAVPGETEGRSPEVVPRKPVSDDESPRLYHLLDVFHALFNSGLLSEPEFQDIRHRILNEVNPGSVHQVRLLKIQAQGET
ncbi:uvrB_0 [Symbiodinium sp. CCMP2456]|nr:uvrB_0 [Symbiodinium sp. CCMP2456]